MRSVFSALQLKAIIVAILGEENNHRSLPKSSQSLRIMTGTVHTLLASVTTNKRTPIRNIKYMDNYAIFFFFMKFFVIFILCAVTQIGQY